MAGRAMGESAHDREGAVTSRVSSVTAKRIEVKATDLHGLIRTLRTRGLFGRVAERVSAETAAMMRNPPPITSWVDAEHNIAINDALWSLVGDEQTDIG